MPEQGDKVTKGVEALGFYTLAGHIESPAEMLDELRLAEELGLGNASSRKDST